MANIHTFGDMSRDSNRNQGQQGRVAYAPLDTSQNGQSQGGQVPLFSFGFRNPDGTFNSVNCLQAFFPEFSVKSFVFIVTMLQVLIFLTTKIMSIGYKSEGAFSCILYEFGGKYTPAILVYYHVHRLLLPILLHAGFGHIFFNMLSQWLFGFRLEKTYGFRRFVTLYLLAGVGGNLLSAIQHTDSISVGASSSLFGLFAFQIAYLIENYENLGPRRNIMIIVMVLMILANVDMGTQSAQGVAQDTEKDKKKVDNSAHFGGFIVGLLTAVLFIKRESDPNFRNKQRIAFALLVVYFVATSVILATMKDEEMEKNAWNISTGCGNMSRD